MAWAVTNRSPVSRGSPPGAIIPSTSTMTPDRQRLPFRTQLSQPTYEYKTAFGRWLSRGESVDGHGGPEVATHPWGEVIWLTGVGYFSTLGYQPRSAPLAAAAVAPAAPVVRPVL